MHLHKNGQKDYIKELKKQKDLEIKAIKNSSEPNEKKQSLVAKVIKKFTKLIKDTNDSLFIKSI